MDIVKAFNTNDLHTEVVIKGTKTDPLFRASDIGIILEINNIRMSIIDFDESEKRAVSSTDSTGRMQDVTFLTEKGLYKVLFRSRKPIAQRFQDWVCEVIKEIRLNGLYELQKEVDQKQKELEQTKNEMSAIETTKNKEMEEKLIKQKELDNEKFLLKQFNNAGNMVYIIKVKTFENGSYVVKIGESRIGIMGRYNEHKSKYEECTLLDCFCVNKSKDFEHFLHSHSIIKPNIVKNLPNHDSENELFLIGGNLTYKVLSKIVNDNIDNYNYKVNELLLEIENLKFKNQENAVSTHVNNDNELLKEIIHTNKILLSKVNSLEQTNKEILSKLNSQQEKKIVTGFNQQLPNLGPRLQKINPETLQLTKVYESVTDSMNESKHIKRPSIMKAIAENTIYCGFRWLLVERNLDPNIIHEIKPTKETKVQNLGYIAQLDKDKTKIVNVYIDRKTAAHFNGYTSSSALDNPVKNNSLANGFYYMLYNNCDDELTSKFEEINGAPMLYKNGVGQYDTNNNLIKEFECKYDCIKSLAISDKTLTKALTKNIPYNGHYYKEIGAKLKMV
jgi:prophage antirepressor-like protein